ncbi:MAG TPA: hypothetical protein VEY90_05400 [Thermoleophilaceae bacterium]|nr:hypothetical protein [Thermoleophilaceae bacterium]
MSVPPLAQAIPENLADLAGNTPLVGLTRLARDCGAELVGKLEAHNPAGSVKTASALPGSKPPRSRRGGPPDPAGA